ncbi:alpha/beta hydrolase family protein [Secundilactobacillus oryzae]|nr:S9 family peptidase [Secundilactobacillus oryzae]
MYTGDESGVKLVDDQPREVYDFAVAGPNKVVLSVSKQDQPNELVELDLTTGAETSLFNPNADYERQHTYSSPKHFDYRASDGQALEGWYLPPHNPKAKNPVLLYVHGGPHAAYGESFFYEFQVYTTLGYGVVFVNPRGSTTYGQDFVDDVTGHYGERDFSDVMSGLDYALEHFPELDADHQYIAGGSYGGFMTTWTVGHTDRFNAAVAQRSVTNWISMYGYSDIGFYFNRQELRADLFEEGGVEKYWKMSPLAYAHNVKTPLRLLHGEWDMRCPIGQSEEFYTAVKQTGTDVDFIRYPQAFHGVSRDGFPNLRLQRIKDMDEWFSRY